jgi:hypothetical protein
VAECEIEPEVPVIVTVYIPPGVALLVAIVNTTFAELIPGTTEFGLKLQSAPDGTPVQERLTTPEKADPVGVIVRL